jgi:hypothetical protein
MFHAGGESQTPFDIEKITRFWWSIDRLANLVDTLTAARRTLGSDELMQESNLSTKNSFRTLKAVSLAFSPEFVVLCMCLSIDSISCNFSISHIPYCYEFNLEWVVFTHNQICYLFPILF